MSVSVRVYTWSNCPYCVRAIALLESKGIAFEEINLDGKDEELHALRTRTGWRTVPQIFIGEEMIGGYTDLAALEASGKLEKMLHPGPTKAP